MTTAAVTDTRTPRQKLEAEVANTVKRSLLAAIKPLNNAELGAFYGRLRLGEVDLAAVFTNLLSARRS